VIIFNADAFLIHVGRRGYAAPYAIAAHGLVIGGAPKWCFPRPRRPTDRADRCIGSWRPSWTLAPDRRRRDRVEPLLDTLFGPAYGCLAGLVVLMLALRRF
jgi:hypothetical protein